jgi:heme exporter protein C
MRTWKWLLLPWMTLVIVGVFTYAREARGFVPGAGRIIFFHVPQAMLAVVGFLLAMIYAVRYLRGRQPIDDIKSETGAELGLLCCVMATITGSLFAKVQWGSYWHWDARESSIVVLMLIYGAYFALRASVDDPERRARLAATYAIYAFVTVPFLVFVVPRIPALNSLHPKETLWSREGLSTDYRVVLYSGFLGFAGVFSWLFSLAVRVRQLALRHEDEWETPAAAATPVHVRR